MLADVRHRLPLLGAERVDGGRARHDWDAFFSRAAYDPLLEEGLAVATTLALDHDLVYLTGRPERLRGVTVDWLAAQGLPAGRLLMRRCGDRRPARTVKREAVRRLARERPVGVVVDDDPEVAQALRSAGFSVLLADWGEGSGDALGRQRLRHAQEEAGET